ncbi:MAG: FHA domain-containing protein, partial [Acidobacteriota bacterium]
MAKLRIDQRNQPTREFPLDGDEVTIGRGIGNTLHFRDPWLSRDHARLIVKGEGFVLEDSRSRNGTFLNGEALSGEQPLRHGDVVTLGDVQLTFLDEASTGLHLADSGVSLETRGTVMISSEELRYDSYRDAASSSAGAGPQAADPSVGILPALHNVTSALVRHFPLDELADKVLELVLDAVQADRAALLLRPRGAGAEAASADGEEDAAAGALRVQSRRGYGESDEVRISRTIVRAVLEERKAVLTMDAQSDARFGQAVSIMMQGIRSVVAAPLINTDRQVIGLIYLDDRVSSAVFNEDSLRLIGLIANLAAVKVENCYLLEEQLEKRRMAEQLAVGAQIQRGLLPASDPNIEGYEVCGANRSCFEIGGDYYDFIHKEDGRLA